MKQEDGIIDYVIHNTVRSTMPYYHAGTGG
jgi:hypothetical protein